MEEIISILNYVLNEFSSADEARKDINLKLCMSGYIQLDAIGKWIRNFNVRRFANEWGANTAILVYTGDKEEQHFRKSEIKCNCVSTVIVNSFLSDSNYVSFVLNVAPADLEEIFAKMKVYFKDAAERFPTIKMSLTGDIDLLQDYRYVRMMGESLNDMLKYSCSQNFRGNVLRCFGARNKQDAINEVCSVLTDKLKHLDEEDE